MSRLLAFAAVAALCAGPLAGGLHAQISFGLSGAHQITRSRVGATQTRFAGALFSGEAAVIRRRVFARVRYGQGRVTNDTAGRDVVEGDALVGYQIRPWLDVWVGPHVRTFFALPFSDRRWLYWSGGVAARGSPFPGRVETFVELWQGFTGRLSRPAASARGGGVEAGVELRLARQFRSRVAYRFEQGRVDGGARETVEAFTLTIGYVPRR